MWESIFQVIGAYLIATIAVERSTEVITSGDIFAPIRDKIGGWAFPENKPTPNKFWNFWHKLITCSYCASHWVAVIFVWSLPGKYFLLDATNCILVKWIALVGLANLFHAFFNLVYRGRVFTADVQLTNVEPKEHEDVGGED